MTANVCLPQIWFQNRRQITRRKAQPLSPYEILSNLRSSQDSAGSFTGSSFGTLEKNDLHGSFSPSTLVPGQLGSDDGYSRSFGLEPRLETAPGIGFETKVPKFSKSNEAVDIDGRQHRDQEIISPNEPEVTNTFAIQTHAATMLRESAIRIPRPKEMPGYLANRRSASFCLDRGNLNNKDHPSLPRSLERYSSSTIVPLLPVKHASTNIRLSLSLDGKARVVTGPDDPPSPPRLWSSQGSNVLEKRPGGGLQRSWSAVEPNEMPSAPRRSMIGRSRDTRAWEFYCDSEASNALTEQAELEKSGSAIGPIGLIRSGTSSKAMRPNLTNRNVQSGPKQNSEGRLLATKPKLSRANSSLARLQTIDGNEQRVAAAATAVKPPSRDPKRKLPSSIFEGEGGDSDKENWEPGTQQRPVQRRRAAAGATTATAAFTKNNKYLSSHHPRRVLEENSVIPSHSSSLDSLLNREDSSPRPSRPKKKQQQEQQQLDDDEPAGAESQNQNDSVKAHDPTPAAPVAAAAAKNLVHCSTNTNITIPRAIEDLEGVQNLLSLSQARWR